jgi:hypothetical protein
LMVYLALAMNEVSFLTALLFSINPLNMQGSVWISGRNYVVSAILTLAMFSLPKVSWIFYMATSHFAVNAWFAPIALLGTSYWYMAFIIPFVWLLNKHNANILYVKTWDNPGLKTTNKEMRAVKPKKLIVFVKTYIYYFSLCIFPYRLGIEHDFLRGFGTNQTDNKKGYKLDWIFWTGGSILLVECIAFIYCIFNGWNPILWGLFFFTVNIAMWCNLVTIQQQIAERFVYLANIGMMYALANVLVIFPIAIPIFLTAYLVRLWYSMDAYLSDWWAVEYNLKEQKKNYYMWIMRGVKKFLIQDYIGSLQDFNEALIHKPYELKTLYNLAVNYFILGDTVKAKEHLEKAKLNVYDELEDTVKPAFLQVEDLIRQVEEAKARGETQLKIDLSKLIVVKVLTIIFPVLSLLYASNWI